MQTTQKIKKYFNQNDCKENLRNLLDNLLAEEIMKEQNLINETNAYQALLDFSCKNIDKKYTIYPSKTFYLIKQVTNASDKEILEIMKSKSYIFTKNYPYKIDYIADLFDISPERKVAFQNDCVFIKYHKYLAEAQILSAYYIKLKNTPSVYDDENNQESIPKKPSLKKLVNAQMQDIKNNKELQEIVDKYKESDDQIEFDVSMRKTHPDTSSLYSAYTKVGISDINLLTLLLKNSSSQQVLASANLNKYATQNEVVNNILAERLKTSIEIINEVMSPKNDDIINQLKNLELDYKNKKIDLIKQYIPNKQTTQNEECYFDIER